MGKFGDLLRSTTGQQVTGGAISTGLGLLLQNHNDRRQIEQQRKLSEQQLGFDLQKMKADREGQLQMWKDTSYAAQREQMEKAGLNPALMYGMGGGGGMTTGGSSGGVGGPSAQGGSNEIMGMAMMKAQLDLMKAQARKTETEADNIGEGGVERRLGETKILDLATGIENKAAQTKLVKVQTDIAKLDQRIKNESFEDVLEMIEYNSKNAYESLRNAYYENELTKETFNTKIATAQAELIRIGFDSALKQSGVDYNNQKVKESVQNIAQGWTSLSQQDKRILIETFNSESNRMNAETGQKNADTNVREFLEKVRSNDNLYELGNRGNAVKKMIAEMQNDTEIMKMTVGQLTGILNASNRTGGGQYQRGEGGKAKLPYEKYK
jgi:hypothetical protein